MMKKIFLIACAAYTAVAAAQTKSTDARHVEPYRALRISGMIRVILEEGGDATELTIKAGENSAASNVDAKVEKGVLSLDTRESQRTVTTIEIHNRNLSAIELNGIASFKGMVPVLSDTLKLDGSGATEMKLLVESKKVEVTCTGAANISIAGTSEKLEVEAGGAASLKALDLKASDATVNASGAANVKVNVSSKIRARATGASNVRVQGDPKDFRGEASGSANIRRLAMKDRENGDSSSVRVSWNNRDIMQPFRRSDSLRRPRTSRMHFNHWAGLSIGINGLVTQGGGFSQPVSSGYKYMDLDYSRCINFQLNAYQHNFHLYRNYVNLVTGIGFEWRRLVFENRTVLDPDSSFTGGYIDQAKGVNYISSMLKSAWIQVPLLLDVNSSARFRSAFHFSAGVIGQFLLSSKTKRELDAQGDMITIIHKDNYNINPFQLKAHLAFGYSYVTVFAEYSLTPLFAAGKGPVVYPVNFGVRFVPFVYRS